jgi:hypothetical protein
MFQQLLRRLRPVFSKDLSPAVRWRLAPKSVFLGAATAFALLVWAPAAPAATTFGSDVSQVGTTGIQGQNTRVQDVLPSIQVTSPVSGVVVRWRLSTSGAPSQTQGVRLRIIRPVMLTSYMAVATDPTPQPVSGTQTLNTYATRLSIQVGDKLGVETTSGTGNLYAFRSFMGAQVDEYPASAGWPDGGTQSNIAGQALELIVNADVEPDADGDGFGDETQDLCPTNATTQGVCPSTTTPPSTATTPSLTGQRAAALKKCKKKFDKGTRARKKCINKANLLPV